MQFNEVHILFEQSGTFKKVFADKKYTVREYDIENTPAVDISCDIFEHIDRRFEEIDGTIFENIPKGSLVLAFFPCTYFSDQSQLISRGDSAGQKTGDMVRSTGEFNVFIVINYNFKIAFIDF